MSDYGIETAQRDLRRIMAELGMSLHARPESSHEVVLREVLPRIRELRANPPITVDPGSHTHEWHEGQCLIVGCDAIDPADVKVGDVVEVEAPPDVGLPWRLEGTVINGPTSRLTLPPHDLWISFKPGGELLMPRNATVRLVRRAEPEPDPEQVRALADVVRDLIQDVDPNNAPYDFAQLREAVTALDTVARCGVNGDGLRDELILALDDAPTIADNADLVDDAVLPVLQRHLDAARRDVLDYRARLKATDESWAKVAAARDAAVARTEAAEQALQRVRERVAEEIAVAIELTPDLTDACEIWMRDKAIAIAREHAKGEQP